MHAARCAKYISWTDYFYYTLLNVGCFFQYFSTFTSVISMFKLSGHVCHFEIRFVYEERSCLDQKRHVEGSRQLLRKCLIGTFEMVLFLSEIY